MKLSLEQEGLSFKTEKEFSVNFQDTQVGKFRVDLLIEDKVIVEIKSLNGYTPVVFAAQLRSYLKASDIKTGLLVNFGNKSCEINRFVV